MGGTRLWDLSGRQNWSTLTNTESSDWVVNAGKGALDLDGVNEYSVTNASYFSAATIRGFSVSMWMRTTATNSNAYLFSLGSSASDSPIIGFRIDPGGNGSLVAFLRDNAGTFFIPGSTSAADAVNNGNWNFIVLTIDGATAQVRVNGSNYGTAATITTLGATTINRATIGALGRTGFASYYSGQLDDIRIYNRALSAGEVRQLWQIGRGNMPLRRRRRYTEQAAGGFKGYWANRQHLIGSGVY